MANHKDYPDLTVQNLIPVHSGRLSFAHKLKLRAARPVGLVAEKMKEEHEQLLERLRRLQ